MSDEIEFGAAHDGDGERPYIVSGTYFVTLAAVVDGGKSQYPSRDRNGEPLTDDEGNARYPDQWKWTFRVDDVDAKEPSPTQADLIGKTILRWTNKGMGPQSHTRLFIEAMIGHELHDGDRPKSSQFVGRMAKAVISAREGKISKQGFALESCNQPAVERMAAVASGDNRDKVLQDLYDMEDRRDLSPILDRIKALGLSDDEEVDSLYELTFSRLGGAAKPARRNTQQPALA